MKFDLYITAYIIVTEINIHGQQSHRPQMYLGSRKEHMLSVRYVYDISLSYLKNFKRNFFCFKEKDKFYVHINIPMQPKQTPTPFIYFRSRSH